MAEAMVKLEGLDRAWIKKALELQKKALVRAKSREIGGSEIDQLRGKEIAQVDTLMAKF